MGICAATEVITNPFDEYDVKCNDGEEMALGKYLLLGTGCSGKTTIFNQLCARYGKYRDEAYMKRQTVHIHKNVIFSLQGLIRWSQHTGNPPGVKRFSEILNGALGYLNWDGELNYLIFKYVGDSQAAAYIMQYNIDDGLTPETADIAIELWQDPAIQKALLERDEHYFPFSIEYLMSRLDSIQDRNYLPTLEDTLHCRRRTTGIFENEVRVNGNRFNLLDVGGFRSERKKWIHFFEGVTCILYVSSLADYDSTILEDSTTNAMSESLTLFDELYSHRLFHTADIIVFLNKSDIFRRKIKHSPFSSCPAFATYNGPDPPMDFEAAIDYIISLFRDIRDRHVYAKHKLYFHVTSAVDTTNAVLHNAFENIIDLTT